MIEIKVFGPGCPKCKALEARVRAAVTRLGADAEIEKISDFAAMARAGVLATPGLAVNGALVCSGRVPGDSELEAWLQAASEARLAPRAAGT